MRFFDTNIISRSNGGDINGTSGNFESAFSETTEFSFQSDAQGSDGDLVTLERVFLEAQSFDSLAILKTNFKNTKIEIKKTTGGVYEQIDNLATITTSKKGDSFFYQWETMQSFFSIRFSIENTLISDQEKNCGCILAFEEIGNLYIFSSIKPKKKYKQKKLKLDTGGVVVVNKGEHWAFNLKSKHIGVQEQADIIEKVQNLGREFFVWINSGYEKAKIEVEPYTFDDFIKCVHTGSPNPSFYKNYLNNVLETSLVFEQTGQLK